MLPVFLSHFGLISGLLLGAALAAWLLQQERAPSVTIAWLLVMLLLPYVGIPLYLLFGSRKIQAAVSRKSDIRLGAPGAAGTRDSEILLANYGIPSATADNTLEFQPTPEGRRQAIANIIAGARHELHIGTFILHADATGSEVVRMLTQRAAEGVSVRVLLDGLGSFHTPRHELAELAAAGGQWAFFLPVLRASRRVRANLRNHRKMIIADGVRAISGGANIGDEYLTNAAGWTDLSFQLEGSAVAYYANIFRSDWAFATGESLVQAGAPDTVAPAGSEAATLQVIPSGPDVERDPLYDALIDMIYRARQRLWVATPYFIPDEPLLRALRVSAHRGVDIRILVPQHSNHKLADLAGSSYLRQLAADGVHVLHFPHMLHAKAVLMDHEMALLGSANIDMRSLFLNFETGLAIYSPVHIQWVADWLQSLMALSSPAMGTSSSVHLAESFARLLAPQL